MMSSGRSHLWRRRSGLTWLRAGLIIFIIFFIWLQLNFLSFNGTVSLYNDINDSNAALLSMVPVVLHKFLTPRPKNLTNTLNGTNNSKLFTPNITDIKRNIAQYNAQQFVYNEDIFGPLQNDSVVIVIQVIYDSNYFAGQLKVLQFINFNKFVEYLRYISNELIFFHVFVYVSSDLSGNVVFRYKSH